jgi:hypothetical protein
MSDPLKDARDGVESPPPLPRTDAEPGAIEIMVPYRNPLALWSYYLGIFSLLPLLGFFTGVTAVVLGVIGLRRAGANPRLRGKVHAWVGIVCGALFGLGQLGLVLWALLASRR